jgi:hypothetical protein
MLRIGDAVIVFAQGPIGLKSVSKQLAPPLP